MIDILGTSSLAWADVVKLLLNAHTAVLDIIVGDNSDNVIHDEIMGSRIHRTVAGSDLIIDLEQQIEIATRWGQGYVFIRFFKETFTVLR